MKKILTVFLSIVLVITSISVGFIASAAGVNANVESVDELNAAPTTLSSANRLSGTPYVYASGSATGSYKEKCDANSASSGFLYDGNFSHSWNSPARNGYRYYNGLNADKNGAPTGTASSRIVLELGKVYAIDELLVAGSNNQFPIAKFEIYLGDDFDTLFSADNKVVEYTRKNSGNHVYHIKLKEAVTHSYFGVKFLEVDTTVSVVSDKSIYLNELGAYGALATAIESPSTVNSTSIIWGATPVEVINNQNQVPSSFKNGGMTDGGASFTVLTNGKVNDDVNAARIWNMPSLSTNNYGGGKITYALQNSYKVSKVLLASGSSTYTYVSKWKVYASDTQDNLYDASNLRAVVENTSGSGRVIDAAIFNKPVNCKYVGIQFVENKDTAQTSAYLAEIGIYGTNAFTNEANLEITSMPGENVISKAAAAGTVKTYLRQGNADDFNKWNDRTTSGCHSSSGSVNVLYDNSLASVNRKVVNTNVTDANGFYNMSIVFETSAEYTVNAALLALDKTNMAGNTVSYIVYVGNKKETLFSPENVLAVSENASGLSSVYVSVPAEKAKSGKFFGIMIKGSNKNTTLYPNEVAFFEPNDAYGENVTASSGVNLIDGNTMKFYQYGTTDNKFNEKVKDANNQSIKLLTDGKFNNESNKSSFRTTGLCFYNAKTSALVFDAGKSIDVSRMLFAGGVSLADKNDTAFGAYSVYVGNTLDSTLFNAENKVAYYANCDYSQIQSFDLSSANVSGRYIAIKINDIYTHYTSSGLTSNTADTAFYITEFAVYGNWSTDAYTVVNEPNESELPANELEYATLSNASDDAGGILTNGTVYSTSANEAITFADADSKTFTYDLDAKVSINSFLIGSKYDANTNLTPANYKIYVADTLEGLDSATAIVDYYPANYAQNSSTFQGSAQQFVLKNAAQGRFVRFEFTKAALANGDINLTELAVYTNSEAVVDLTGTIKAPKKVYTDGSTAEFEAENNQLKLAGAMSRGQHSLVVVDGSGNTEVYFIDKGTATRKEALDNALDNKSALLETDGGIEFKSSITDAAKAEAQEIGIAVAKKANLNGADLLADAEGYKSVKAIVFDGTVNELDGNSFSATVNNFEPYKYLYRYAARPYIKVDGFVVYGEAFDTTPAEAAQAIVANASDYSAEIVAYAQNIVDNSGLSDVALARAEFLRLESVKTDGLDAAATLANSVACNETVNLARLKAVIEKAQRGEDIVLGTLGGSITQGFNANYNPATGKSEFNRNLYCWSNLLREWLANTFNVNVTLYNAGIGSTTSTVGVGRVVNDILSHNPDLIVIDYAVNDSDSTSDASKTMTYAYEALTRRILNSGDDVALMMMFAAKENLTNKQEKYAAIGNHYGIPMISYRDAIAPLINDGTYVRTDFSNDTIHPHAYGHQVIAALFGHYIAGVIENLDTITDTVTALPDYTDSATADDVKSLETATLYHSNTLPAEWVESFGSFAISNNIHAQFPNGWLVDYSVDNTNSSMVINVPNAKKLIFLIHNKGTSSLTPTYANAQLTFVGPTGTSEKALVTNASGDYANEIIRYDCDTAGAVKVTIKPQTTSDLKQFKLLGIIVCE